MIEVYEGETHATVLIKNDWTIESITGYHTLFDENGDPLEVEHLLTGTEEPIGDPAEYKNVTVEISEFSEWPVDFRIEFICDDDGTERIAKSYYTVVTPYAQPEDIAAAAGVTTVNQDAPNYRSYQQVRDAEALARSVIESVTGEDFTRSYKSVDFAGTEKNQLFSSEPFLWVGAVSVDDEILYSQDTDTVAEISPSGNLLYLVDDGTPLGFPRGYKYQVVGIFGYQTPPRDIELATKMLAAHYLCSDAAAKNAYVEQVKFGESATKTNRRGFAGTGLMAVDRLLEQYQFHGYRVL